MRQIIRVVIDPGHGGTKKVGGSSPNNATGSDGVTKEKDVVRTIANQFKTLVDDGHFTRLDPLFEFDVRFTRSLDVDENKGLAARVRTAGIVPEAWIADYFISLHLNGNAKETVQGTETWVNEDASNGSKSLATKVQEKLVEVTRYRDRGLKVGKLRDPAIKNKSSRKYVTRQELFPVGVATCLVESSFLTGQVVIDGSSRRKDGNPENVATEDYRFNLAKDEFASDDEEVEDSYAKRIAEAIGEAIIDTHFALDPGPSKPKTRIELLYEDKAKALRKNDTDKIAVADLQDLLSGFGHLMPRKGDEFIKLRRQIVAQEILELSKGTNPRIFLRPDHQTTLLDRATAKHNIEQTARGEQAVLSTGEGYKGGTVMLYTGMLETMLTLASSHSFGVSEIVGGKHGNLKKYVSRHYKGIAFDIHIIGGKKVNEKHSDLEGVVKKLHELGADNIIAPKIVKLNNRAINKTNSSHKSHIHAAWKKEQAVKQHPPAKGRGVYDKYTKDQVTVFQRKNLGKRAADGIAGKNTIRKLVQKKHTHPIASRPYLSIALKEFVSRPTDGEEEVGNEKFPKFVQIVSLLSLIQSAGSFVSLIPNSDKQGLSLGIFRFSQKSGEFGQLDDDRRGLLKRFFDEYPELFKQLFGPKVIDAGSGQTEAEKMLEIVSTKSGDNFYGVKELSLIHI